MNFGGSTPSVSTLDRTRVSASRLASFKNFEKAALKLLPTIPFDVEKWEQVKLRTGCYAPLMKERIGSRLGSIRATYREYAE